ncbi:UDP-glucose 4-epimerase family protein [Paramagnetospirillum magneticum]|uniref:Nucleoside-diphosphate-sugar epimerase n=1 Tax=Paramagnetospirillum magneticum (strain ATCC 700264 / AMB-1) TaxID=342108 RepID=Q2WBD3_PARM1|nr:SDR family oxidoreductase [Paramagnetospirillum magneticum]BAE48842.1 Nucleoside-diphosphate-sugar epimerase [Paramagnetospirillum magneticum AMB-1]
MRVLVTGANGFVGQPLCRRLAELGHHVAGAVRGQPYLPDCVERRPAGRLVADGNWSAALEGMQAVVHLAARVHVMHDASHDPLAEFRAANGAGTLRLAEQAAQAGIGHLVFLSSIKANGEETTHTPFGPLNAAPVDPYGISKLEAEQGLAEIAARTGLAVTVLRPPLVYGPGVKGNFRALIRLVNRGLPLPLGCCTHNRRSLIGLGNLVDAIRAVLDQPPHPGQCRVFTLCDAEAPSTADLVRSLARALGRPARLLPIPVGLMRLGAGLLGKGAAIQRLTASLEVDGSALAAAIGWVPPETLDEGLTATARWWRNKES